MCQIDYLASLPTDGQRQKALAKLPKTLSMTYERILKTMLRDDTADECLELARKTLHWIAISDPPLTIPQLCAAVSVQDSCRSPGAQDVVDESNIARVCSSLIRKTRDGRRFEFAHFTVREYLVSIPPGSDLAPLRLDLASASKSLAMAQLRYLLSQRRDPRIPDNRLRLEETSRMNMESFHTYASAHWVYYAKDHMSCADVLSLAGKLYHAAKSPQFQLYAAAVVGYVLGIRLKEPTTKPVDVSDSSFTPLHLAAILGIPSLCRLLVEEGQADADGFSRAVGLPLNAALVGLPALGLETAPPFRSLRSSDKLETVKALLNQRASCTLKYEGRDALAAYRSPFQILESLDDPAVCSEIVACAVFNRHFITAFKSDLQQGTVFSKKLTRKICTRGRTNRAVGPLFPELVAAIKDMDHAFGLLEEASDVFDSGGPDIAPDGRRLLRMLEANDARHLEKAITDHSQACRDVRFAQNQTLLHRAVVLAHTRLVRVLTASGFPLDIGDDGGETALHKCLLDSKIATVKLLVDSGANPMAKSKHGRSAWHVAAMNGSTAVLDLLILSGCDVPRAMQMRDNDGDTPLALAILCGRTEVAQLLLELCGVDPSFSVALFHGKTLLQLFIEDFWDRRDRDSYKGAVYTFRALLSAEPKHQPIISGMTAHEFLLLYPTGHFEGTEMLRPDEAHLSFCLQFCDAIRESITPFSSEWRLYSTRHAVCLPLLYIVYSSFKTPGADEHMEQLLEALLSHCGKGNGYRSDPSPYGVNQRMHDVLNHVDAEGCATNLSRILSLRLPEPVMKIMAPDIKTLSLARCDTSAFGRVFEALSTNDRMVRSYQWLHPQDEEANLMLKLYQIWTSTAKDKDSRRIAAADMHKWRQTFTISYDCVAPERFQGCNLMHAAALLGLTFMLDFLLVNKVFDINVVSKDGWTPLHFAARGKQGTTLRFLQEGGADRQIKAKNGMLAQDFNWKRS